MRMSIFFLNVYSAVCFFTGFAFIVVALEWREAPRYQVHGARVDFFAFSFDDVPFPNGQQLYNERLVRQLNLTIEVSLSNLQTPSPVEFRELKIDVTITNKTVGVIHAPGPFHVHGRGVLALGGFNVIAANISWGPEPETGAMDLLPVQLSGHAYTSRKVAFFFRRHQTPKMECVVNFKFPSGDALLPFKCKSHTPTQI